MSCIFSWRYPQPPSPTTLAGGHEILSAGEQRWLIQALKEEERSTPEEVPQESRTPKEAPLKAAPTPQKAPWNSTTKAMQTEGSCSSCRGRNWWRPGTTSPAPEVCPTHIMRMPPGPPVTSHSPNG